MLQSLVQKVVLPLLNQRSKKHKAVLLDAMSQGIDIENPTKLLDFYLKTLNYHLDPGVFEKIEGNDYLEIYDRFLVQIFRTYNIFKYTTYTFEELFTKRVDELYERNDFYGRLLLRAANKLWNKKTNFETNFCPEHIVTEKKLNGSAVCIGYKFMAPVYCKDSGDIIGILVCEKIRPPSYAELEQFRQSGSLSPGIGSPIVLNSPG